MDTLHVNFGPRSYPIGVTAGNSSGIGPFARQQTSTAMAVVVSDENVQTYTQAVIRSLEAEGFRCVRRGGAGRRDAEILEWSGPPI